MAEITLAVAALAGLGSFVAPCILPMIPAFLAYISGSTISELNQKGGSQAISINRTKIILNTVFFVLGFSVVFSTLGVIINSTLTSSSAELIQGFNQVGGVIIVGFGVFLLLSTKITKLNIEKKFIPKRSKASYPLSFVFGLAFAAGWTPCVGLGIPFILMGVFFSRANRVIKSMSKHLKYYNLILGGFIILLGILVFTNQLAYIANFPLLNDLLLLG
jgi:cytochrome c-type biogenesis protein